MLGMGQYLLIIWVRLRWKRCMERCWAAAAPSCSQLETRNASLSCVKSRVAPQHLSALVCFQQRATTQSSSTLTDGGVEVRKVQILFCVCAQPWGRPWNVIQEAGAEHVAAGWCPRTHSGSVCVCVNEMVSVQHMRAVLSSSNGLRSRPCSAECLDENVNIFFASQFQVQSSLLTLEWQVTEKLLSRQQQSTAAFNPKICQL